MSLRPETRKPTKISFRNFKPDASKYKNDKTSTKRFPEQFMVTVQPFLSTKGGAGGGRGGGEQKMFVINQLIWLQILSFKFWAQRFGYNCWAQIVHRTIFGTKNMGQNIVF